MPGRYPESDIRDRQANFPIRPDSDIRPVRGCGPKAAFEGLAERSRKRLEAGRDLAIILTLSELFMEITTYSLIT